MDQKFPFEAQGYLALSPKQVDDTGALLGRHWLATSNLADVRLTLERSSLILLVSVKDTVYIRITVAEKGSNGMLQQAKGPQPRMLTPHQTCSCWCLASVGKNVRTMLALLCTVWEQ